MSNQPHKPISLNLDKIPNPPELKSSLIHLKERLSLNPDEREGDDYATGFANGQRYGLLIGINAIENETAPQISLDSIININSLKQNDLIIFKIKDDSDIEKIAPILQALSTRYGRELRAKNISVVCLDNNQSIEVVSEVQMNKMGWFKKEEKRIITI